MSTDLMRPPQYQSEDRPLSMAVGLVCESPTATCGWVITFLFSFLLGLLLGPAMATASQTRELESQVTGLRKSNALAIGPDQTLWAAEAGDPGSNSPGRVSHYNPYPSDIRLSTQSNFSVSSWGILSLALDQSSGDLYVVDPGGGSFNSGTSYIDIFGPSGAVEGAWEFPAGEEVAHSVAVDNSGSSSQGRVYVSNNVNGSVEAFEPNHAPADFSATGLEYITENRITGTPAGPLPFRPGVAVGPSGEIFVFSRYSTAAVYEYAPSGKYLRAIGENLGAVNQVAVDPTNGNILVAGGGGVHEFTANGSSLGIVPGSPAPFFGGVAVNSLGYLYVSDGGEDVDIYSPAAVLPKISYSEVTEKAHTSGVLNATIDPNGGGEVETCKFEYGLTDSYGESVPCSPTAPYSGSDPQSVSAEISGLTAATVYHYRVVATNANGTRLGRDQTYEPPAVLEVKTGGAGDITPTFVTLHGSYLGDGVNDTRFYFEYGNGPGYGFKTAEFDDGTHSGTRQVEAPVEELGPLASYHYRLVAVNPLGTSYGSDQAFETPRKPIVDSFTATELTATSAKLTARVNPGGADTTYQFEYGPSPALGSLAPASPEDIGAARTDVTRTVHLEGLAEHATYYFRVLASNRFGTVTSEKQTFNFFPPGCPNAHLRQQVGAGFLPDCRSYELASAAYAGSSILVPSSAPNSPYATSPSRVFYTGVFGAIPETGDPVNSLGDLYEATRTPTGWETHYIGLAANETGAMGCPPGSGFNRLEYFFDLAQRCVLTNPSMGKVVDWSEGNPKEYEVGFPPGASNAPYVWSSSGQFLERWPDGLEAIKNAEKFKGETAASADLSHFVFSSDVRFVKGTVEGAVYDDNIETGEVLIASRAISGSSFAAHPLKVSADGSHILLSSLNGHLFMRVDGSTTFEIAPGHKVSFVGMTADGSKVYLTSEERLTPEDTDNSTDLYMWSEKGELEGTPLTLVSQGPRGAGNDNECHPVPETETFHNQEGKEFTREFPWTTGCDVVPISFTKYANLHGGLGGNGLSDSFLAAQNGDIYFYSPEQLDGLRGVPGGVNLYDYREGRPRFVATLSPEPVCTYGGEFQHVCSEGPIARMDVTPDDSHAAFITTSRLTEYDNAGHAEIYSYEPTTEQLRCDSCDPAGEPPTADVYASQNGLFQTEDGRVFFATANALVPQDTNGGEDVYEYSGGRLSLITPGTGESHIGDGFSEVRARPGLVSVSANGADVYFSTYETLVPQDRNGSSTLKIYDARTNGGFPVPAAEPPCAAADECHGVGSPPEAVLSEGTSARLGTGGNAADAAHHHKKKHRRHRRRHRRHHSIHPSHRGGR